VPPLRGVRRDGERPAVKKHFLVTLELPDWADQGEPMERVREEIEQHAGACVAFFTRATQVRVKCEPIKPTPADDLLRWIEDGLELRPKV
jgi:hypothetical protein